MAVAFQAPLSMEFPRQEYWTGLPSPPSGDLPDSEVKSTSPALQTISLPLNHLRRPLKKKKRLVKNLMDSWYAIGFLGCAVVKNLPANAGNAGDAGLIPG